MTTEHVIIGMSGGVDSSVAALKLLEQGYKVTGLFMKNWDEDDGTDYCTAIDDLSDAQQVSDTLGIELKTVNFAAEYWDNVFEIFLKEYAAGRTPNPDILCNKEIKFKAFLDYAQQLGADYIATGHYVQNIYSDGEFHLTKGSDSNKDQSYFLYTLGQEQLKRSLFPIGDIEKPLVREIATKAGFINNRKKDSTGICFIGERKFKDFLQRYLPAQPGLMVTPDGEEIAKHDGLMYYTLGQRQGLGIGGKKTADDAPWYVVKKDLINNKLIVAQGHDHPMMLCDGLNASQMDWVTDKAIPTHFSCSAKTRYRQQDQACDVTINEDNSCTVIFKDKQRAVTPGQSVVFYTGNICLGGGVIDSTF